MRSYVVCFVLFAIFFCGSRVAEGQSSLDPVVSGVVTRAVSSADFDVDGFSIRSDRETAITFESRKLSDRAMSTNAKPRLGEGAKVYGKLDKKRHSVYATLIIFAPLSFGVVKGGAVVDAILPTPADTSEGAELIRADGYPVLVQRSTKRTFEQPITAATPLRVNLWLQFEGHQRSDGIVVADSIQVSENILSEAELKRRKHWEYDPSAVEADAKQSFLSKQAKGRDPKQYPVYKDEAMQARVSQIGERLIPKYQHALASDDDNKINYRFQVVDMPNLRDATCLPGGIILVPRRVVERLENDSQLAAVIASKVVCELERQQLWKFPPALKTPTATTAAILFLPIITLPVYGAGAASESSRLHHLQEQTDRVGLSLMHDAGYDLKQAPIAWWILASGKEKVLNETSLPSRARYLYEQLGTTWNE